MNRHGEPFRSSRAPSQKRRNAPSKTSYDPSIVERVRHTRGIPVRQRISFSAYQDGLFKNSTRQAGALEKARGHIYSRNTNPTVRVFEEKVRLMKGADAAISFASGMAAISDTLFTLLRPGDRMVSIKDSYGGTNRIFTGFLPEFGIETALCDTNDHLKIETEVHNGCSLLYFETPTNPTLMLRSTHVNSRTHRHSLLP